MILLPFSMLGRLDRMWKSDRVATGIQIYADARASRAFLAVVVGPTASFILEADL